MTGEKINMLDLQLPSAAADAMCAAAPVCEGADGHVRQNRWLRCSLDCVDYPMLCMAADHSVLIANRAARRELADPGHPLRLQNETVCVRKAADAPSLQRAMRDALMLGLRRLVVLGGPSAQISVAVVPVGDDEPELGETAVLLMFGKRKLCESLSADWYARERGLTGAEARVLQSLSNGLRPKDIAQRQGVAVSTVRTHLRSLRSKTGAPSIRELLRQVSTLPPMLSALRCGSG